MIYEEERKSLSFFCVLKIVNYILTFFLNLVEVVEIQGDSENNHGTII